MRLPRQLPIGAKGLVGDRPSRCARSVRRLEISLAPGVRSSSASKGSGAVLLEVIVALALFVFAAAVISTGLNAAVDRTLRLHEQAHALDLASSVLAEVEMGLRPAQPVGPEPCDPPFESWTWQIEAVPYAFAQGDSGGLQRVTAIVRSGDGTVVQRLTRLLESDGAAPLGQGAPAVAISGTAAP